MWTAMSQHELGETCIALFLGARDIDANIKIGLHVAEGEWKIWEV